VTYADKILLCRDCGKSFPFTAAEQESFVQKGHFNDPGRCAECRAARKARGAGPSPESARAYSAGAGGGYTRGPRELFAATCSACGQTAQVPFQPRNDKPVYCSNCFEQKRAAR